MQRMHEIVRDSGLRPTRALEVGGYVGRKSLLRSPEIKGAERFCINLVNQPRDTGIHYVVGNANHMEMFDDESFDLVMSNAVLEHDKHFWLSLAEMKRVTRPGGLLVIGVPGFVKDKEKDRGRSTATYRMHYRFDYYRFSGQAVRDVFFADMENVTVASMLTPPRIIGSGYKPATPIPRSIVAASNSSSSAAPDEDRMIHLLVGAHSRPEMWFTFLNAVGAQRVAEIGVYRGHFAARMLQNCPAISSYYMIDPWRHLEDWNKPANRDDEKFEIFFREAMRKTSEHADRRIVLRGRTTEVIDTIPDGTLDFAYIDGDHTLRGITIDLVRIFPKVRPGGWIGGDDFSRSIWQHREIFEPTLVFPFAVHFAEAVAARIHALPHGQFLLHKGGQYQFVDHTGRYDELGLRDQLRDRAAAPAGADPHESGSAPHVRVVSPFQRLMSRRSARRPDDE